MISYQEANRIFETAEQIYSADVVSETVNQIAVKISEVLGDQRPLVLTVMNGAVVFAGQLLPLLRFPLNCDYIRVSRYNNTTQGGQLNWKVFPGEAIQERVVLVLDDVLDEGMTLAAIRERVMDSGAEAFYSAVFAEKDIGKPKPINADFVGLTLPNRYVFGFGMDIHGMWRNLPAIYAIKD